LGPNLHILPIEGLDLAVWDWPGEGEPFFFAHDTGFHGRLWDPVAAQLAPRTCFALDARGHGHSAKPAPPYRWRNFGRDLAAIVRHLGLRNTVGVGHSMGGHALTVAAALAPECFRTLLLVDPSIFPPERYGEARLKASVTLRRKNVWRSAEEMWERFHSRPPFASWKPEVLRAYCEHGLMPQGGHLALACPPAAEVSIYEESNAPESNIYAEVAAVELPVTVLRAASECRPGVLDLGASPTAPDLAQRFAHGRDLVAAGHSHYIPMEDPLLVAEEARLM